MRFRRDGRHFAAAVKAWFCSLKKKQPNRHPGRIGPYWRDSLDERRPLSFGSPKIQPRRSSFATIHPPNAAPSISTRCKNLKSLGRCNPSSKPTAPKAPIRPILLNPASSCGTIQDKKNDSRSADAATRNQSALR